MSGTLIEEQMITPKKRTPHASPEVGFEEAIRKRFSVSPKAVSGQQSL
jgi:hypothetical protein